MVENVKKHVIATIRSMMKPIIMLLLRNGVTYKEFSQICKSIFVEAAAEDYGIRGRPTNVSRISVITGIDRKEVKRIKDLLQANHTAIEAQQTQDRITRILTAWHQDKEFTDESDEARRLPVEGSCGSFTSLVKRFGGDIPVQAFLKEMERVGLVQRTDAGIQVLARYYFPANSDPEALLRAGSVISELAETLFHNLYFADDEKPGTRKIRRFERRASNNRIDPKYKKAFYKLLNKEGQEFLERIDDWMSRHEIDVDNSTDNQDIQTLRLSISVSSYDKPVNPGDTDE